MKSVYYSTIMWHAGNLLAIKTCRSGGSTVVVRVDAVENVSSVSGGKKLAQYKTDTKQPGQQVR